MLTKKTKMEFEHYEAHASALADNIEEHVMKLVEERGFPLDLLPPAIDNVSIEVMKKLVTNTVSEKPLEIAVMTIALMMRAQKTAYMAKLEWLKDEAEKLKK